MAVSLFSVIVSAFTLTSLTMAWINTNENVDRVQIVTGEGVFEVHAGIFERKYEVDESNRALLSYVDAQPNFEAEYDEANSSNEALAFNFIHNVPVASLDSMVHSEHALNTVALPSYVFELHAHTILDLSYIRLSLNQQLFPGSPQPDFSLYTFQYLIVDNDPQDAMEYASPVKLGNLEVNDNHYFNGTTPQYFTDGADAYNAHEIAVSPADTAFYSEYFAKSIIVLLKPDPVAFFKYLQAQNLKGAETKYVGINFQLYVEFSIVPFTSV